MDNKNIIKQFIRDRRNNPRGYVVAIRHEDEVFYGYSLCNPIDRFNKALGLKIATARAMSRDFFMPICVNTQRDIENHFKNLESRALKYFKDLPEENVRFFEEVPDETGASPVE
jgi:hypothetical protein